MPCHLYRKIAILGILALSGFCAPGQGATINVGSGGDFQAAVNQANSG